VGSTRELYERFRHLINEGWKFLVVGAVGAVVTIGGAEAMQIGGMDKYVAVTIATIVATVVTFVGNRYWTFSHRAGNGTAHESTMFFILNGVGLLIYYACIWIIQDVGGLTGKAWYGVALIVGTVLGTLFRFWSYRKWVWGKTRTPSGGPPAPGATGVLPETLSAVPARTPASHRRT
jgi:putative flippase GtrA